MIFKIGTKIIYARGAKGPLIGQVGYVETEPDAHNIVMVKFSTFGDGASYPCWIGNLDLASGEKLPRVVHCKKEPHDIYIGRGSRWGNPYSHKEGTAALWVVETREDAIRLYEEWLRAQPELMAAVKKQLRGKILGCYCSPLACHGDVLLKIANEQDLDSPSTDLVNQQQD